MRYVLILCIATAFSALTAAVPAEPVQLANERVYQERLRVMKDQRPDGKNLQALGDWLQQYFSVCLEARAYSEAETAARALLALAPHVHFTRSNLSVALGKQGKYQEALQEAEIAKLLSGSDSMHADIVACSWLWHLGRKQEANERFAQITVPTDPLRLKAYLGSKACFIASMGAVDDLKRAIAAALRGAPETKSFFERDGVFDPYRGEAWFIELVGVTLAPRTTPTVQ